MNYNVGIILAIIIIVIFLLLFGGNSNKEHMDQSNAIDYEAIANVASIYNSDDMTVNKLVATGDITGSGDVSASGDMSTDQSLTVGGDATVTGTMISDTINVGGTTGLGLKMMTVIVKDITGDSSNTTTKITDSDGNAIGDDYICMTVGHYTYGGSYSADSYEYRQGVHCYYDSDNGYWKVKCSLKLLTEAQNQWETKVHVLAIPKNLFDQTGGDDSLYFESINS